VRLPISLLRMFGWPFKFSLPHGPQISYTMVHSVSKAGKSSVSNGQFVGSCWTKVYQRWIEEDMVDESMISLPIGVRPRWRSSSLTKFGCIRATSY